MSVISVFGMIGILCVALLFFTAGPSAAVPCFIALWVLIFVGGIIYHIANATSDDGVNTEEFSFKVDGLPNQPADRDDDDGPDFAERLRDLKKLHDDKLITDEEYQAKRAQIMSDKW